MGTASSSTSFCSKVGIIINEIIIEEEKIYFQTYLMLRTHNDRSHFTMKYERSVIIYCFYKIKQIFSTEKKIILSLQLLKSVQIYYVLRRF